MGTPTQYYVDPSIAANSGTGTIGDPFGDIQYALNTVTKDTTNGDQFNIKAGTAEVLAADLSFATYGAPGANAPCIFRGYTSAANDGGIASIDCSSYVFGGGTTNYCYYIDLNFVGGSATYALYAGGYSNIINCRFDSAITASNCIRSGTSNNIIGCAFYGSSQSRHLWAAGASSYILNCYFEGSPTLYNALLGSTSVFLNNVVNANNSSRTAVYIAGVGITVENNSFYNSTASTAQAIYIPNTNGYGIKISNNIIEGYSGVGGYGIRLDGTQHAIVNNNRFYNCTTNIGGTGSYIYGTNNSTLAASAYTNPAGVDFTVGTEVKGLSVPPYIGGTHVSTIPTFVDIGAAQREEPTGGGGGASPFGYGFC